MSASTWTRSDALCSAPPPLEVLRMAACTSLHAALWRLILSPSWSGNSLAMCVHASGRWQSGHSYVGAWSYHLARLPLYNFPYGDLRRVAPCQGLFRIRLKRAYLPTPHTTAEGVGYHIINRPRGLQLSAV